MFVFHSFKFDLHYFCFFKFVLFIKHVFLAHWN